MFRVLSKWRTSTRITQAWFYGEGVTLPTKLEYDLTLVTAANDLADRWDASRNIGDPAELDFKRSDIDALDSKQRGNLPLRLLAVSDITDDDACSCVSGTPGELSSPPLGSPSLSRHTLRVFPDD